MTGPWIVAEGPFAERRYLSIWVASDEEGADFAHWSDHISQAEPFAEHERALDVARRLTRDGLTMLVLPMEEV